MVARTRSSRPISTGRAVAGVAEGDGGADDLLLLALGEDHAARVGAHALADRVERVGGGIEPAGQLAGVAAQVGDRLAGDAGVHRRLGDGAAARGRSGAGRRRWG